MISSGNPLSICEQLLDQLPFLSWLSSTSELTQELNSTITTTLSRHHEKKPRWRPRRYLQRFCTNSKYLSNHLYLLAAPRSNLFCVIGGLRKSLLNQPYLDMHHLSGQVSERKISESASGRRTRPVRSDITWPRRQISCMFWGGLW